VESWDGNKWDGNWDGKWDGRWDGRWDDKSDQNLNHNLYWMVVDILGEIWSWNHETELECHE